MDPAQTYSFLIKLYESTKDELSELPHIVLELELEELNENIEKILFKAYKKFIDVVHRVLKKDVSEFNLFSLDGNELSLTEKFSAYSKNQKEFYLSSVGAEDLKLKINQSKEKSLLKLLLVNIKDNHQFSFIIGKLPNLIHSKELHIGQSFKFNENQKADMRNIINYLKFMGRGRGYVTESDTHTVINEILSTAVVFADAKVHNEYYIKPEFKYIAIDSGVIRRADCGIYYQTPDNIICLTEVKKEDSDINECIRQNADQLRANCFCKDLKIGRGIATSGMRWIFTEYQKDGEKLKISDFFRILEIENMELRFLDNFLDFFETLISFLKESFTILGIKNS